MQIQTDIPVRGQWPVARRLTPVYALSLLVALVSIIVSVSGLVFQTAVYSTEAAQQAFVVNDAINLIFGLPILLGTLWLTRHGRLLGLLLWPGALLYVFYNEIAYVIGMPFGAFTFIHMALVLLSAVNVFILLRSIDQKAVQSQLAGRVPIKFSGWVLVVYGSLFLILAISTAMEQTPLAATDIGLIIADTLLSILLIAGGALLLRQTALGFAGGLGLLFAVSALFIGLILVLLLQPLITDVPFDGVGVITLLLMSAFCLVGCLRFARGVNFQEV